MFERLVRIHVVGGNVEAVMKEAKKRGVKDPSVNEKGKSKNIDGTIGGPLRFVTKRTLKGIEGAGSVIYPKNPQPAKKQHRLYPLLTRIGL